MSTLFKGGSAEKAGLELNDIKVSSNDRAFNKESYCDFYDYSRELLDEYNDIILKVKRGESVVKLRIEKRDLFE